MPPFRLAAFTDASLAYLLAHPLALTLLVGAAALVVGTCVRRVRREASRRAVRAELLELAVKYPPRRLE